MSPIVIRFDPRLPGLWGLASGYLARALAHGGDRDWELPDVYSMAVAGQVQLWALVTDGKMFGACVTTESIFPKRKVLEILLLGTEPHSDELWGLCTQQMMAMARAHGYAALTGSGRPGWARKLGASREHSVWELDLGDTQ